MGKSTQARGGGVLLPVWESKEMTKGFTWAALH